MEITVIAEEENPMLHRTDVRFRVSHAEATPDRLAVRDSLAARLNKSADEVVIRRLDTKFGMRETVGEAKVYQGAEFAKDVEQEYMLARNKIGDEHAEAAADAGTEAETDVEAEVDDEDEDEVAAEEADVEPEADDELEQEPDADADEAEAGAETEEQAEGTEPESDERDADEAAEAGAADEGEDEDTETGEE